MILSPSLSLFHALCLFTTLLLFTSSPFFLSPFCPFHLFSLPSLSFLPTIFPFSHSLFYSSLHLPSPSLPSAFPPIFLPSLSFLPTLFPLSSHPLFPSRSLRGKWMILRPEITSPSSHTPSSPRHLPLPSPRVSPISPSRLLED